MLCSGVALLTACDSPQESTIRFGLASAPINLDPRFATDAASSRINRLLYERLVEFDDHSLPTPGIATWQRLAGEHYRFQLRESLAPFHNGRRVTAHDVVATYASILEPATASPHRASLANIRRVVAVDAATVDFFLREPDLIFPGRLTIGIMPADLITSHHPFNQQPLGSGAFMFESWPTASQLTIKRRRDQQRIALVTVKEPTVRALKLLRGEVDLLQNDLPPELIGYLQEQAGIVVQSRHGSSFAYLGFNLQDEWVGRHDVRSAIAHAIDRQAIITYLWGGKARLANGLFPPDHWVGSTTIPQ
ncbi:MAG: peptide/nickel transport system substrate-binding protein, partial [Halothiobacillaceae bacterium]